MNAVRNGGIYGAALLISIGIGILTWQEFRYYFVSANHIEAPLPVAASSENVVAGTPERLAIPSLNIDLPVLKGTYDKSTQTWTLTDSQLFINTYTANGEVSAAHTNAPTPLIYGHNYPSVLGKTRDIKAGAELSIITDKDQRIDYIYIKSVELKPTDDWILNYKGKEDLLLMTCDGLWDENRKVMFFEVEK